MKKFALVMVLVAILSIALVSPVLARGLWQEPVDAPTLPQWAIVLLNAGVTWLLTNGLKSLSKALPWVPTLEGPTTALTGALVMFVVTFANGLLSMIPGAYHPAVIATFTFIGSLLSAYGIQGSLKQLFPAKP